MRRSSRSTTAAISAPAPTPVTLSAANLVGLHPSEVGEWARVLLADGNESLAQSLCDTVLAIHPNDPDALACATLLAQIREDWVAADDLLRRWVSIQRDATPAYAWRQWVRVLRCLCEPADALDVAIEGCRRNPTDANLVAERIKLESWLGQHIAMRSPPNQH